MKRKISSLFLVTFVFWGASLFADIDSFELADIAKKRVWKGTHVSIYIGMGYTDVIARFPNGKITVLQAGAPFMPSQGDINKARKIENETKKVNLAVRLDNCKWHLLKDPCYSYYALYLAKDKFSQKNLRPFLEFTQKGKSYFIDFSKMRQVRVDNPRLTRSVKWIKTKEKVHP